MFDNLKQKIGETMLRKFITAIICLVFTGMNLANAANLGVGFSVLPNGDTSKVGNNNQLWFALDAGEEAIRRFQVTSASTLNQEINISYVKSQTIDGKTSATNVESEFSKWFEPSENNFELKSRQSKTLELKAHVPNTIQDGTYRLFLKLSASNKNDEVSTKKGTYGVVNNAVSFFQEIFVIVGEADDFTLDFEIKNAEDYIDSNQIKHLVVNLVNTGNLPLGLSGTVELISLDFEGLKYGPFSGGSTPMLSKNTKGEIDFSLGTEIQPGNYKILVQVKQADVLRNKIFEQKLTFPASRGSGIPIYVYLLLLLIGAAILFRYGFSKLNLSTSKFIVTLKPSDDKKIENLNNNELISLEEMSIKDLEAILAARLGDKTSKTKKSPAKRTSKKPVKKAVTSKKASKANSSVKKTAKKSPTKKTVKKVAKKSPVKRSSSKG